MNCARSSRRPRSRKRQPVPRVMFSCARPDRMATKRTMSSRAASSGSRLPRAADQALADHRPSPGRRPSIMSTEKRSRMRAGQALDGVEHVHRARARPDGDGAQALLEGGILRRRQAPRPVHQAWRGCSRRPSRRSSIGVARTDRALRHLRGGGAQQAGIVVEPLDVAAEPVEIVGDAALQVGAAAFDGELVEAPRRTGS